MNHFENGEWLQKRRRQATARILEGLKWLHSLAETCRQEDENPNAYEYRELTPWAERRKAKAAVDKLVAASAKPHTFSVVFESQDIDGTLGGLGHDELDALKRKAFGPISSSDPDAEFWNRILAKPAADNNSGFQFHIVFCSEPQPPERDASDVLFSATRELTGWLGEIGAEHVDISYVEMQHFTMGQESPQTHDVYTEYLLISDVMEAIRALPTVSRRNPTYPK